MFKAIPLFGELSLAMIVILIAIVFAYCLRLFLIKLQNNFDKSGKFGLYALCKAIANPAFFLILAFGLCMFTDIIDFISPYAKEVCSLFKNSILVIAAFWFAMNFTNIHEKKLVTAKDKRIVGIDKMTLHASMKICKALIIIIAIIFLMGIFGVDIRGILTLAGISGAAIGFASKDLLANFFGAIMLFIDKPFSVGDKIKLSDGKEGQVEYIGWRVTRLRTFESTCIYLANSLFSNMLVENLSMRTNRLITCSIRFKYSDLNKIEEVTKEIRDMLLNHPEVCNDKRIDCFVSSFEDSHIDCKVNAFSAHISMPEFLDLNQRVMIDIAKVINKHKLEIAFPARDVNHRWDHNPSLRA